MKEAWCDAVEPNDVFLPIVTMEKRAGEKINTRQRSKTITIDNLQERTTYYVYCFGKCANRKCQYSSLSKNRQQLQTKAGFIEIKNIRLKKTTIMYSVESNLPSVASCVLFDKECKIRLMILS